MKKLRGLIELPPPASLLLPLFSLPPVLFGFLVVPAVFPMMSRGRGTPDAESCLSLLFLSEIIFSKWKETFSFFLPRFFTGKRREEKKKKRLERPLFILPTILRETATEGERARQQERQAQKTQTERETNQEEDRQPPKKQRENISSFSSSSCARSVGQELARRAS